MKFICSPWGSLKKRKKKTKKSLKNVICKKLRAIKESRPEIKVIFCFSHLLFLTKLYTFEFGENILKLVSNSVLMMYSNKNNSPNDSAQNSFFVMFVLKVWVERENKHSSKVSVNLQFYETWYVSFWWYLLKINLGQFNKMNLLKIHWYFGT